MCVSRATVGRDSPVRCAISVLPSRALSGAKASSTASPFASVVANAASDCLGVPAERTFLPDRAGAFFGALLLATLRLLFVGTDALAMRCQHI